MRPPTALLGIGWVLVGYWLGIGWVLVGYWLGIGWVLVGYWFGRPKKSVFLPSRS